MAIPPPRPSPTSAGTRAGPLPSCRSTRRAGGPARVVAAHRDTWLVATPAGEHEAVIAGRLRHEAIGPGDLPAVGDWVRRRRRTKTDRRDPGRPAPPDVVRAQRRRDG